MFVCPVSTYEAEFACSIAINILDCELSGCPVSTNESDCELSASLVFPTEMSTSPVSVDAPGYGQFVCMNVSVESDFELC